MIDILLLRNKAAHQSEYVLIYLLKCTAVAETTIQSQHPLICGFVFPAKHLFCREYVVV